MIQLSDVTLITFTSVRIPEHIEAMNKCIQDIEFGDVKFLSDKSTYQYPDYMKYIYINELKDIQDYNLFTFLELGDYIETSHALLVQDHAYIINSECFDPEWLNVDYIGAIWPLPQDDFSYRANTGEIIRNGNGGFSLRSARMLRTPKEKGWYLRSDHNYTNEDGNSACYWRKEFLELGIKYGTPEMAAKFSYETPVEENDYGKMKTFGFHRNLPPYLEQNPFNKVTML